MISARDRNGDGVPSPSQMTASGIPPEIANSPDTPERAAQLSEWMLSVRLKRNRSRRR